MSDEIQEMLGGVLVPNLSAPLAEVMITAPDEECEPTALLLVAAERCFQRAKFGQQDKGVDDWLHILVEELGEGSKVRLEAGMTLGLLREWVQVAAVGLAACASMLRRFRSADRAALLSIILRDAREAEMVREAAREAMGESLEREDK